MIGSLGCVLRYVLRDVVEREKSQHIKTITVIDQLLEASRLIIYILILLSSDAVLLPHQNPA